MSTVAELSRERETKFNRMKVLLDRAETATRDLSDAEKSEFDALYDAVEALDRRCKRMNDVERLSAPGKRITPPPPIGGSDDFVGRSHKTTGDGIVEYRSVRDDRPVFGFSGKASIGDHFASSLGAMGEVFGRPNAFGRFCQFIFGERDREFLTRDERRVYFDQATAPNSAGGYLSPEVYLGGYFVDALKARMVTTRAGSIVIPLESDHNRVGRLVTAPTVTVHSENAEEATTSAAFDSLSFTPRTLGCWLRMSDEFMQDCVDGPALIEKTALDAISQECDRLALVGGASSTPVGLVTLAGNSVTQAPSSMDFDDLLDAVDLIQQDNATPTAYVLSSATSTVLAKLKKNSETHNYADPPADVQKLRKFVTEAITSSYALVGDFSYHAWGIRQGIAVKRAFNVMRNAMELSVTIRLDFNVTQPNAFCKISA